MLAHGLYTGHALAMLCGLHGLIVGIAAVVKAARGSRRRGIFAGVALGSAAIALACGAHLEGSLLRVDGWSGAWESPDFRVCFVPGLALGLLALLVGACRRSRIPPNKPQQTTTRCAEGNRGSRATDRAPRA